MAPSLSLRQVEIFRAVMLHGTTRRAAEVLNISQPGVSKALQELEHYLGLALFHRERKRLSPTAEARLWFSEVESAYATLARLGSAAARIRDFGTGQLRIATLSALSTNIVPRALKRFRTMQPGVSITLQTRMSSTVRDIVLSGGVDIGLAADEIDMTGVDARELCAFPACLALPPDHPLTAKSIIEARDLHNQDFIALSPEDTTRRALDEVLRDSGSTPRVVAETPFAQTICAMVMAGLGCGVVNPVAAAPFEGRGIELRPFTPTVTFRSLLIRPAESPVSRVVADFIQALEEEIGSAAKNYLL